MDFISLDGSVVSLDVKPSKFPQRKISAGQTATRARIEREFGNQTILEEFPIPKSQLRLDFFLPNIKVAVEYHGRQHDVFVKHFHGTLKKFQEAKRRDELKAKWCEINGIELVIWYDA
jgi:hypothetical protein